MSIGRFITLVTSILLPLLFLILFQSTAYGQPSEVPPPNRDFLIEVRNDLLDKSQNQKILAWVMMGVGMPVLAVGWIGAAIGGNAVPGLIGLGTVIGSITLFVASSKNQTKALKMDLGFIPDLSPPGNNRYDDRWSLLSQSLNSFKAFPGIQLAYTF